MKAERGRLPALSPLDPCWVRVGGGAGREETREPGKGCPGWSVPLTSGQRAWGLQLTPHV